MGKRIERVNELIKRELSKIFLEEIEIPKEVLVTISRVETTKDLKEAKVFLSIYPFKEKENIVRILKKKVYLIQKRLNKTLVMSPLPRIKFEIDESLETAEKIQKIIDNLA